MLIEFVDHIWQADFSFLERLQLNIIPKLTEKWSVDGQVWPTASLFPMKLRFVHGNHIMAFCVKKLCTLVSCYQHFGTKPCFYIYITVEMETMPFLKLTATCQTARCPNPQYYKYKYLFSWQVQISYLLMKLWAQCRICWPGVRLDIGRAVYHFLQYIYTFQRDTQCSSTDCLLILRCQLCVFRTVTVHPQELLFRCCMCKAVSLLVYLIVIDHRFPG